MICEAAHNDSHQEFMYGPFFFPIKQELQPDNDSYLSQGLDSTASMIATYVNVLK